MIAAGSLFTSCVENTEPQGIRDLREAKADYLASLSKLREADAEKVKAEAAVEQAKAEVQKAIAAQNQALAEAQQIANEAASIANEEAAARAKAAIDTIKAKAALDAVKAQEALAKAQADLDKALRKIAAEAIGLTGDEKYAITEKTFALNMAYGTYNAWLDAYNGAVKELWEAEYAVAAGKESYETADSYRDSIADVQAKIAELEADIASYEALKAEPAGIKDTLDAIAEEITALDAEITTKGDVRKLYEASVPFKDAKDEFAKRVKTFKNDSLKGAEFIFADEKEGNYYYKEYPLTDGKHLDFKFAQYLENEFVVVDFDPEAEIGKTASDYGYFAWEEDNYKTIYVGGVGEEAKENLEKAIVLVDEIVEGLNRELVVVDNILDSTNIEDLKKAAHDADSIFDAHYAILKAGLKEYAPYKDSVEIQDSLKLDTAAANKAHAAAVTAYNTVKEDSIKKDVARIAAVKTAAAAYDKAVTDLVAASKLYKAVTTPKAADSTAFLAAIKDYANAQIEFLGKDDSLDYVTYDPITQDPTTSYDHFSNLNPEYFKLVKGKDYSVYGRGLEGNDVFTKILKKIAANIDVWEADKDAWIADVKNPLRGKETPEDSIVAVKDVKVVAEAIKAFDDFNKTAVAAAKHDADSTANDVTKAETALSSYKGVTDATIAYQKIYKSFWGITGNLDPETKKACVEPQEFTWTKKTFLEPENCVIFNVATEKIIPNNALVVALNGVDVKDPDDIAYSVLEEEGYKNVNESEIFFGKDDKTEFAKAILAAQIAEEAGEYVPNKARLEKINAQVAKIKEDVEAAIAEYEAAKEGLKDVEARFYGVDEDGEILFVINPALNEWHVADGKWNYGGYLLAWAEELAPEYPGIVKEAVESIKPLQTRKHYLAIFKKTLDQVYTAWWNEFEKEGKWSQHSVAAIVKFFKDEIDDLNDQIDVLNGDIARYEEIIDACEAGYSPAEAKVAPLKKKVEAYKKYLEQAEEALARAQKEYDEVIAKYGVKE